MKIRMLSCLLLLFGCCGNGLAEDKAIGLQGIGLATTTEGGQKWALVVGINGYYNVPALSFAQQDATVLYTSLVKAGFPRDNIMLMTDTATGPMFPTRGNLRARISQLATLVEKEDVLLVFFSGHGTERSGDGYLVPIDGSTTDIGSLIPLSWIKKTLETSSAKHRLLILDACHSGAKAGDAAAFPARTMLSGLGGAAFATLSSCDADQLSYEDKQAGHGVFTSAIIEGLRGAADKQAQGNNDNVVNATELWAYAALKTRQWGVHSGKVQTPILKGNFKGLIEIAHYKVLEDLNTQKDKLRKKLKMMEQLNRDSAVQELRNGIAKLGTQLSSISGGADDITGSDEVQLAYTRYDSAKKQMNDLGALLAEKLKVYQPTSKAIAKIKRRLATAESELETTLKAKSQADAIMVESLKIRIDVKRAQYDELIKELLPTAPQAKKILEEIDAIKSQQKFFQAAGYFPKAGEIFTNYIGMKLTCIPAGEFVMGSNNGESDEKPVHNVKVSKGFHMGIYEVTQAQYHEVMGGNPSRFKGDNNPVERVTCNEAVEFCKKLSRQEGMTYRLPTEAEWEYACRAGSTTVFSFGNSESSLGDYAWHLSNSGSRSHPVGQKKPNAFGLYDMHGNVWEWCADWYGKNYYKQSTTLDSTGPTSGSARVLRSGSWISYPGDCRSANRGWSDPVNRVSYDGFRVVLCVSSQDFP